MNPFVILTVIVLYFSLLLIISYFTSKGANSQSFFLGNRSSKWYIVAFGMIGTSLSGVTFISVPGWVATTNFSYMQMILGNMLGYITIAFILMPVYYRLNLISIYTYLDKRFGRKSYKTGAVFFLISRTIGSAFRLFLVANVLQITMFDAWGIPFWVTVILTLALIWLYTNKAGIKTIIWTDTLQTLFLLTAVVATIIVIGQHLNFNFGELVSTINKSDLSKTFEFSDWASKNFFFKQFLSGAFITIVMTGLDQDMMQKNLSCKNIKDAQKNMLWYGFAYIPVNLLFLTLGALLVIYSQSIGLEMPQRTDDLYPLIATQYLGPFISIFFIIGLIAAAYSSADSALAALTTSFTVDILGAENKPENELKKVRRNVHIMFSGILAIVIIVFRAINDESVISSLFVAAGYTYGPLLGLYAFGLFSKYEVKDRFVPYIAIFSPIFCYLLNMFFIAQFDYKFGYELLILNGLITFIGLFFIRTTKTFNCRI